MRVRKRVKTDRRETKRANAKRATEVAKGVTGRGTVRGEMRAGGRDGRRRRRRRSHGKGKGNGQGKLRAWTAVGGGEEWRDGGRARR